MKILRGSLGVCLFIFSSLAIADSGVPIGQYVSELPSQASINLPSTALTGFYPPIQGSISMQATASRAISQSTISGGSNGGETSSFALAVDNDSGSPVYINLQGINNTGAWGTACEFEVNSLAGTQVDYVNSCVGVEGISSPSGLPISLYLAKQSFVDLSSFQSASHFLSCTLTAPSVTVTNNIISLPESVSYQLNLSSNGNCTLTT